MPSIPKRFLITLLIMSGALLLVTDGATLLCLPTGNMCISMAANIEVALEEIKAAYGISMWVVNAGIVTLDGIFYGVYKLFVSATTNN